MGRKGSLREPAAAALDAADPAATEAEAHPGPRTGPGSGEPDPAGGRLRVVFLLRVADSAQDRFLEAYERIRYQVASVDGYLGDQLCQSTGDPAEWMITSEWESPAHFLAWEGTAGHRELAAPLVACTTERRSLRYVVRHQTARHPNPGVAPAGSGGGRP